MTSAAFTKQTTTTSETTPTQPKDDTPGANNMTIEQNPTDDVFDEPTFTYEEFSQYDGLWLRHLLLRMTSPLQQAKTTPEE
ncbi:Hypp6484 [Branchiostoma lanceolatum]|uniref:Hypp6484 protein n=1 Tax=Branchiostoma lanceolatum TaxID=7740 RepID=A0A8K0E6X4_BRALA|nr:Hypp6484 [Branchiostoma lanceolatum]